MIVLSIGRAMYDTSQIFHLISRMLQFQLDEKESRFLLLELSAGNMHKVFPL